MPAIAGIQKGDQVGTRLTDARVAGSARPAIRLHDVAHCSGVRSDDLLELGGVRGSVVHHDHLVILESLREDRLESFRQEGC